MASKVGSKKKDEPCGCRLCHLCRWSYPSRMIKTVLGKELCPYHQEEARVAQLNRAQTSEV